VLIMPLAKEYYAQRASAAGTLLITEGTFVTVKSGTLPYIPGIWAEEQISAWKEVCPLILNNLSHNTLIAILYDRLQRLSMRRALASSSKLLPPVERLVKLSQVFLETQIRTSLRSYQPPIYL
jgi:NADPH2 dehydrogenase